jgi:hypothetical protein
MFLLNAIGCANDTDEEFKCASTPTGLSEVSVGDNISTQGLADIFNSVTPSIYTSGDYCSENYKFSQFNKNTAGWCYYYDIDVDCNSKQVTSVFTD